VENKVVELGYLLLRRVDGLYIAASPEIPVRAIVGITL
jgi:hypothetical protein